MPFPQEDLAPTELREPPGAEHAADCIATRFVDDAVLSALSIVNMDLQQDYRQAVLLGCGMDTRPFRCTPEVCSRRLYLRDARLGWQQPYQREWHQSSGSKLA